MTKIFSLLTLLLSFSSFTSAMEIETDLITPQTDSGFHKLPKEILDPFVIRLLNQDRGNLFSTCRAWNHYGLTVYYPGKYPDLDSINFNKLTFSTYKEKIRFILLVLSAAKSFHHLSFKGPEMAPEEATEILKKWGPQEKELKSRSKSDQLIKLLEIHKAKGILKAFITGISLAELSEHIITQVKKANTLYNENNPSDWLEGLNSLFSEEDHPLAPLFSWMKECALGNVIVQYSYDREDRPIATYDHDLPLVDMSRQAKNFLRNYSFHGANFLNSSDSKMSGEYGLHVLLFNKWRAFSEFDASIFFDMIPRQQYKITNSSVHSYRLFNTDITIIRIPEEDFDQNAHPIFVKTFMEIGEKKKDS